MNTRVATLRQRPDAKAIRTEGSNMVIPNKNGTKNGKFISNEIAMLDEFIIYLLTGDASLLLEDEIDEDEQLALMGDTDAYDPDCDEQNLRAIYARLRNESQ